MRWKILKETTSDQWAEFGDPFEGSVSDGLNRLSAIGPQAERVIAASVGPVPAFLTQDGWELVDIQPETHGFSCGNVGAFRDSKRAISYGLMHSHPRPRIFRVFGSKGQILQVVLRAGEVRSLGQG